ncbi:MAG: FAD-dependent oxidoreductase [Verrucomicrobia bacterium]|nr:FAD-dependent oxidoreductase [Verrucomicrobiota bacterium]
MNTKLSVTELAREIPIVSEVDVAVVGGGTAGVMAAVGASREGARTAVMERFGNVGGMINMGLMGHFGNRFFNSQGQFIMGGPPVELLRRVIASGATPYASLEEALAAGDCIFYRHEHAGRECLRLLEEARVEIWLHACFSRALPVNGGGYDLLFECKGGRQALRARQVVDCSGEADVACSLGAPMQDEKTRKYSWGLLFEMGWVDLERYQAFLAACPRSCPEWTPWLAKHLGMTVAEMTKDLYWGEWVDGKNRAWPFRPQIMKAVAAGDFDLVRQLPEGGMIRYGWDGFWPEPWHGADTVTANVCMVTGLDPHDVRHVSIAEAAARKYAFEFLQFCRKYLPGFEKAVIRTMGAQTVARGGREIVGEDRLQAEDRSRPAIREDAICLATRDMLGLPLGMFAPRGVPNLLVAGRCADQGYAVRASVQCMAAGYSCGILAALAAKKGLTPMRLDLAERRAALEKHGVLLQPRGPVRENFKIHQPDLPGIPRHDADDGFERAKKLS